MDAQFGFSVSGVHAFKSWFSTTFLKIAVEVMASGLPQVSKMWLGISKGVLPVKHLAPKILMTVNYCGRQLAQWLGLAAPAYHTKEGATPHPGVCKHSLQYDGRPDGLIGVWVGTWNLGSLSAKVDICVELRKRIIDVLLAGGEMKRTWC